MTKAYAFQPLRVSINPINFYKNPAPVRERGPSLGFLFQQLDCSLFHVGQNANETIDALVGDLVAALNKFKVPEREKNELLGALGPMKSDIVEKPMTSMH